MENIKITVTQDDMAKALAEACVRDPLKDLIETEPSILLLLPVAIAEVWFGLLRMKGVVNDERKAD